MRPSAEGDRPSAVGSARDRAIAFIAHQAERFPSFDPRGLETTGLEPRDAALAHALTDAVARRWLTLLYLIAQKSDRPTHALEPNIKAALLVGAGQLLLLDRIPAYAAIDHAVGWTKENIRQGAGGFVNAILRRIAELRGEIITAEQIKAAGTDPFASRRMLPLADGSWLGLTADILPEDERERLAVATAHPSQQIEMWERAFGMEKTRGLAMHSVARPPMILYTARSGYLPLEQGSLVQHEQPGFAVYTGAYETIASLLADREDVWATDPAAAGAVTSIARMTPPPATIVDVCAGQGTKTRHLAAVFPQARIVATDVDARRRAVLFATFKGHPRVRVVEPGALIPDLAGWADLVLLDVPCSNTGVLARRPEAKYRFNLRALEELCAVQRQIVADSIPLLSARKGSAILYATCSLDERENHAIAAWARQWHKFELFDERTAVPTGGPGQPATAYSDGGYSVLLRRRA